MVISLRSIEFKDIHSYRAYFDTVARERKYFGSVAGKSLSDTAALIAKISEKQEGFFVALDGETVVGHIDWQRETGIGYGHNATFGMGLLAAYRGQGIGKQLLQMIIDDSTNKGITRLQLSVYADNSNAIALYQKMGFIEEGNKRNYRYLDGQFTDVIYMVRKQ
jgi:ribosomal protein S18 acetylase RimI-like enzyme